MPVPTSITDCNATAANNSPAGSDSIGTSLDDYLRAHAAILRQVYDASLIPSGTKMPFAQSAAPTGWTQDTTDNSDNRMLRVVKTAGGSVAGSHSPILCNVVPSHTHTVTVNSASTEHTHTDSGHVHGQVTTLSFGGSLTVRIDDDSVTSSGATQVQGASTLTGYASLGNMSANSTHSHTGTVSANGSASDWTPRYIDMIICSKN